MTDFNGPFRVVLKGFGGFLGVSLDHENKASILGYPTLILGNPHVFLDLSTTMVIFHGIPALKKPVTGLQESLRRGPKRRKVPRVRAGDCEKERRIFSRYGPQEKQERTMGKW